MKDRENVAFSQSGVTSWGYAWEWTFNGGVELKAPDGHTLIVTDLHTQVPEYNFEDDLYDHSFSMSPTQDAEWGQICWNCYLLESMLYSKTWESFRSCTGQVVRDFKAKNPKVHCLTEEEFETVLASCLEAIRKQQGWDSEELEWLFNDDAPIGFAVNRWLIDYVERQGLM